MAYPDPLRSVPANTMMSPSSSTLYNYKKYRSNLRHIFLVWCLVTWISVSSGGAEQNNGVLSKNKGTNYSGVAVLVFGDSTSDPGNNNYIPTLFRGNFLPYGRDFINQNPTGRFTNGKLTSDFIVSYVGSKASVPPYLDPTLNIDELMTGVSFASAGSGFDPLTPKIGNVVSMTKQLEYFREYKKRLEVGIGKKRSKEVIKKALYVISAGTNDYIISYFILPTRQTKYTLPAYHDFLLQQVQLFLQGLWDEGARRIAFFSLSPMGCLPIVITLFSEDAIKERDCLEYFSNVAKEFNMRVQNQLNSMQSRLANYGARIAFVDLYNKVSDLIKDHHDFEEVNIGCCGSGLLETSFLCNPKSMVCADASKYIFWDSIHPTQTTYRLIFDASRSTIDSIIKD